jgi:tetrahydromethanopterin S-methyltransferase subunit F
LLSGKSEQNATEESSGLVAGIVTAFIVLVVLLIVGLTLWKR